MAVIHHWENWGLHTCYVGFNTGEELLSAALEVSGDPRFDQINYLIGDWSGSESSNITMEDVQKLASYIEAFSRSNSNILHPSVLPEGESRQAMVALYAMLTEDIPWTVTWFDTLEEARAWIESELATV